MAAGFLVLWTYCPWSCQQFLIFSISLFTGKPQLPSPPNRVHRTSSVCRYSATDRHRADMRAYYDASTTAQIYPNDNSFDMRNKADESPVRPAVLVSKSERKKSPVRMWTSEVSTIVSDLQLPYPTVSSLSLTQSHLGHPAVGR